MRDVYDQASVTDTYCSFKKLKTLVREEREERKKIKEKTCLFICSLYCGYRNTK